MGEFSVTHILLVLGIVLIFFGPSRLPSLGSSMGKAIRGFKDAMKGESETDAPSRDSQAANRPRENRDQREVKVVIQSASHERLSGPISNDYVSQSKAPHSEKDVTSRPDPQI